MIAQKIRATVKSVPSVERTLRSVANAFSSQGRALLRARRYCSALPRSVADPIFVKVGANDGITGDPLSDILLANTKWKGLLIEPVPYCFERLKTTFCDDKRFTLCHAAIGASAGKSIFYYVDEKAAEHIADLPSWYDQLGSFDKNHILKHLEGRLAPFIIEQDVEVFPLADILKQNGLRDLHLLHIDTEGYDYEILKTLDLAQHPPSAIFIEHAHLPAGQKMEMGSLLRKHAYSVSDCGGDYFAVHDNSENSEVASG